MLSVSDKSCLTKRLKGGEGQSNTTVVMLHI